MATDIVQIRRRELSGLDNINLIIGLRFIYIQETIKNIQRFISIRDAKE